ncbi:U6 snRNA-associated Sm-like protein LSm4p [Leishmania mexicana MHOM/GT/2001/U1103]|uniref:U6 snRNA-associated Sm-like protein LSm4 n=1 Tax=Leishmania mexicana (strain MHOM/GT/2001/U1103) TaxID=929439 RepID=E9B2J5_LEIMU|nr:U6 snRNA-associated Sm-like protein LSm4p [Leishmania mexicana MHOM/GT/2001/U1103]CBZ29458.1 U6 snRNA-associated Sm-like protein LSm4p [Leishmania mexicana MHOM/GT/2001/U1103]
MHQLKRLSCSHFSFLTPLVFSADLLCSCCDAHPRPIPASLHTRMQAHFQAARGALHIIFCCYRADPLSLKQTLRMSFARRPITPIEILRNCRGKEVSIELADGETVNGTVMRTDRAMNVVIKQCTRTGADGESFWKARECFVRGASVKNVRMTDSALVAAPVPSKRKAAGGKGAHAHKEKSVAGGKRPQK